MNLASPAGQDLVGVLPAGALEAHLPPERQRGVDIVAGHDGECAGGWFGHGRFLPRGKMPRRRAKGKGARIAPDAPSRQTSTVVSVAALRGVGGTAGRGSRGGLDV